MLHSFQNVVALLDFIFAIAGAYTIYSQLHHHEEVNSQTIIMGFFVFAFFASTFLLLWK